MKETDPLPERMQAMVLEESPGKLIPKEVRVPGIGPREVLLEVEACGVCRTDLHILDGELENPKADLIPGHEIVGRIVRTGEEVEEKEVGMRVGVPWLASTCGTCRFCQQDMENLCENADLTGYTVDGGYAEYARARETFCFPIDPSYGPSEATPLLCAGLIGSRTYRMAGEDKERIGIYGFGAAAHLITQLMLHEGKKVYAFTKPGDGQAQAFARKIGVHWAGGSDQEAPEKLDAAMIFAPVGDLVPKALRDTEPGGKVVCGGIHMSDIPSFPYSILWEERCIRSVANLERKDGERFLREAPEVPVKAHTTEYPLEKANEALQDLRNGNLEGAAVLIPPRKST